MNDFLEEIENMTEWIVYKDNDEEKIYYKNEPHIRSMSLYLECVINAPMMNLFAVMGEVDLFKTWIPLTHDSKILFEVSHLRKMASIVNNLPWPFNRRESFIQACGMLYKEKNACILTMNSVEGNSWMGNKFERNENYVTCEIHKAFLYAEFINEEKCLMKLVMNADPHLNYVP